MATILPFKGLIYDRKVIKDHKSVVCPPYDIIPPAMQDRLHADNPFNVIRLELGKETPGDTQENNKYTRAGSLLREWISKGVLARDEKPAFYAHLQEYVHAGKVKRTLGFFGVIKIEDNKYETVLPHEKTLSKPKEDRMSLIKSVNANLSPIYGLFMDRKKVMKNIIAPFCKKTAPIVSIRLDGVTHKLWRLDHEKDVRRISAALASEKIFIADGHHRYEVACAYNEFVKASRAQAPGSGYVMMFFTDMSDEKNLTIFATHRLIKEARGISNAGVVTAAKKHFNVKEAKGLGACARFLEAKKKKIAFAVYTGKDRFILLELKKSVDPVKAVKGGRSSAWKKLDVAVLHEMLIKELLSLSDAEDNIKYTRDAGEAKKLVDDGSYAAAFLMNPTRPGQIKDVAKIGDTMPQKSTYFYPKLLTGLVINGLDYAPI